MRVRCSGILGSVTGQSEGERRRRLRRLAKDVRAVLVAWDPIPGSPDDEYDCLIWPTIARLDAGAEKDGLAEWLHAEIATHFGLASSPTDTGPVAQRLLDAWAAQLR